MKTTSHFIFLVVLATLASCTTTTTPRLAAEHNPDQPATPTETNVFQEVGLDTAIATPDLAEMNVHRWTSTSPDGRWIAEGILAVDRDETCCGMMYTGLILRSVDGKTQWTVVDEWTEESLGWTRPQPVHWSKDGKSFYYTNKPQPEGCGLFVNGSDLQRVDLDSGKVVEVLPPKGGLISLSPDEKTVVYEEPFGRGLVLRDLASGKERSVSIDPGKEYRAGQVIWSPDSRIFVFTLAISACDTVTDGESTSVLLVDAVSLAVQAIVSEDKRYLVAEEWSEPGTLVLKDLHGNKWMWDMESAALTQQ